MKTKHLPGKLQEYIYKTVMTDDKTASDLRQLERHFIDPDLQLEGINVVSFNDSYTLEKRLQSKYLDFLIPELRKTNGSKYPYKTLKEIVDLVQREIQRLDTEKYSAMLLRDEI